jgi:predicted RNA-binding Zn-ribbon protein involved in translation (DUF1610 family)
MTTFPPPGYIPAPSALDGVQVFVPAPAPEADARPLVDFKCPQCGDTTAYSAADGGLTCRSCGYYEAPKAAGGAGPAKLEFTVETLRQSAQERETHGWGEARKEMACEGCGAVVTVADTSLAYTCPFCGSNKVIQRAASQDALRPRLLIPFKIEAKACDGIVRQWLGSSWMTPADLKTRAGLGGFTGLYLPYWCFDADANADWKAEVGHQRTERYYSNGEWKTRTVTDWRWESGHVAMRHTDNLIPGTGRMSQRLLTECARFNLLELKDYSPDYLAGYGAQAYDVPLENAWESARTQMRERTRQECIGRASTAQVRNFSMQLDFADETWRYLLLPVYLMAYRYGDQTYQAMVNGQNGAIAGQRPVDWNKVWLAIIALLAPGAFFGLVGLLLLAFGGIGIFPGLLGLGLLVGGAILAIMIYTKANAMDDL